MGSRGGVDGSGGRIGNGWRGGVRRWGLGGDEAEDVAAVGGAEGGAEETEELAGGGKRLAVEEFTAPVLERVMPAGGHGGADGNEAVSGEEPGEGAGIKVPEVKGMGEVGPVEAVEGEAHGVAVGHGEVELAFGPEEAGGFAEFAVGVGHVFEAVTEDDGVEGGVGELEIGDAPNPNVNAVAPSGLRGLGTGIDSEHVAAALLEVDEDVAVT